MPRCRSSSGAGSVAGRRRIDRRRLRLVGGRDAERDSYRFYLTNIAPQDLAANDLAQLYVSVSVATVVSIPPSMRTQS